MINSDSKSQSYNTKYSISAIMSSYVCQSLGQRRWNVGLGETFNLSYHMINSDGKLQRYTSKYAISSHNVLICLSKLLSKEDET